MNSRRTKLMAIDYGEKRVGIASTDESGGFALPRAVLKNDENLLANILEFIKKEQIGRVIIGESKKFDGTSNVIQGKIEIFKKMLEKEGVDVIFHPEILSTVEARRLQGSSEMTDASAAALVLKSYLESVYNRGA